MTRRQAADSSAALAAIIVLVLGGLAVVKPAIDNWDSVWATNPFEARQDTKTVTKTVPGSPSETTVTTSPASDSFVERSLGDSGLLLLRIAVVALAAFLAGAVVQRVIMSDFALKVGPVEVPALATTAALSKQGLAALRRDLDRAKARDARNKRALAELAEAVAKLQEEDQPPGPAPPNAPAPPTR